MNENITHFNTHHIRRAETCILLYYMASAVEFSTTKVGCSTFKALWSLSIGPALGMCLFTKISYQNKAPAGWVNKNHQLKPYSKAIYTLPHVWVDSKAEFDGELQIKHDEMQTKLHGNRLEPENENENKNI